MRAVCHWRRSARRDVAVVRLCVCQACCERRLKARETTEAWEPHANLGDGELARKVKCAATAALAPGTNKIVTATLEKTNGSQEAQCRGWQKTQRPRSRFPRGCSDYEEVDAIGGSLSERGAFPLESCLSAGFREAEGPPPAAEKRESGRLAQKTVYSQVAECQVTDGGSPAVAVAAAARARGSGVTGQHRWRKDQEEC